MAQQSATPTPLPLPPGTQDPNVQNAVPDVNRSPGERVLGGIGGLLNVGTGEDFATTPIGQSIARHHQTRLADARRHYEAAQSLATALGDGGIDPATGEAYGIDPATQQRMSPETRQLYKDQLEGAKTDYAKVAGVNPDAKKMVDAHHSVFDFLASKGHAALQQLVGAHQQAQQAAGQPKGSPPPPPPSATGVPNAGAPGPNDDQNFTPGGGLPGPPSANPQQASGAAAAPQAPVQPAAPRPSVSSFDRGLTQPAFNEDLAAYRTAKHQALGGAEGPLAVAQRTRTAQLIGLTPGTREYNQYIAVGTFPLARGMQLKMAIGPKGEIVPSNYDPYSGGLYGADGQPLSEGYRPATQAEVSDSSIFKPISYKGPNGEHLEGWRRNGELFDQGKNLLPPDTEVFDSRLAPTTSSTESVRMVTQPDGRTIAVPVTSVTQRNPVQSSGRLPTPPRAGVSGVGTAVGGKASTQVQKAEEDYNSAVTRQHVMEKSLPEALAGNQQAMINLVANHLGMTAGIQKGSRINQALWEEAMTSAPWLQNVIARFGHTDQATGDFVFDGPLSGVHIPPDALKQMVQLAGDRVDAQKDQWDREVQAQRQGYGLNRKPSAKAAPPKAEGTQRFDDGGRVYHIPAALVDEFKKDHPNAR